MARQEQDREDLMREATALFPRAEFQLLQHSEPVFWGRKQSGHFSFYFGGDPVYQFDQTGHLRRAFLGGYLYRTQGTTLARLNRVRTEDSSSLQRYDLNAQELAAVLKTMADCFLELQKNLKDESRFQLASFLSEGTEGELLQQIQSDIQLVLQGANQLAPRIRGKR